MYDLVIILQTNYVEDLQILRLSALQGVGGRQVLAAFYQALCLLRIWFLTHMLKIHEHFPCSCSALCFSVSALPLVTPGSYFTPDLLKPPERFLLQFICCCIINRLRVSGVTRTILCGSQTLYVRNSAGRVAAPVSGASAGKTHKAGGGREGLGTESPLEVLHSCLAPGLWGLDSGLSWDCWLNHFCVTSVGLGFPHRAVGFQEWASGDPAFQENQAGAPWPFLTWSWQLSTVTSTAFCRL